MTRSRSERKESYDEDKVRSALENAMINADTTSRLNKQFIDITVSNVSRNLKIMSEVQSDEIRNIVKRNIEQDKQTSGKSYIWNSFLK